MITTSGSNNNGFARITSEPTAIVLTTRRGSVPENISELRRNSANGSGKTRRTGSKKLLRRRSSGGPEMFVSSAGKRELKREESSSNQGKRRGSFPVDILTISLTGRYIHR